jgi:hypothetical protein
MNCCATNKKLHWELEAGGIFRDKQSIAGRIAYFQ